MQTFCPAVCAGLPSGADQPGFIESIDRLSSALICELLSHLEYLVLQHLPRLGGHCMSARTVAACIILELPYSVVRSALRRVRPKVCTQENTPTA